MFIFRWTAEGLVLGRRLWRQLKMALLRPAFGRYGERFIFDPDAHYSFQNIEVGDNVSIGDGAFFLASESKIIVGNKVLFGPHVIIIGGNHNTSVVGSYMYDVHIKRPQDDQDVVVEDDVWVGSGAIILKGVRVGRGSIVAAGAIVTKNVLPYTIVAGNPARIISLRFGEITSILEHEALLYPHEKRLSDETLREISQQIIAAKPKAR